MFVCELIDVLTNCLTKLNSSAASLTYRYDTRSVNIFSRFLAGKLTSFKYVNKFHTCHLGQRIFPLLEKARYVGLYFNSVHLPIDY